MIVFTADLHLSPATWAKFPDLRGDAYYAFEQIIAYCCDGGADRSVDALVLGGDIFDRATPDSESVSVFMAGMQRLAEAGVLTCGIQGQHGRALPPWMSLTPNVIHLDRTDADCIIPITCDGFETTLRGMDNTSSTRLQERFAADVAADRKYEILVLHQALRGMVYDTAWNLDNEWVPDFVHIVLLGDLHIAASEGRCHYPGSINLRSISESPHKSFITLQHVDGEFVVDRQPLETRDVFNLTITDEESRDEAVDTLVEYVGTKNDERVARPLAIARISSGVTSALPHLEEAAAAHDMFLFTRDLRAAADVKDAETVQSGEITMDGLVEESLDAIDLETPAEKDELRDFAVRLLRTTAPSDELTLIKKEMGVTSETG